MAARYEAVQALGELEPSADIQGTLVAVAMGDREAVVRAEAVRALDGYSDMPDVRRTLIALAKDDADPGVRAGALDALSGQDDPDYLAALTIALSDRSYAVIAQAIELMEHNFPKEAAAAFNPLQELTSWDYVVERALIEAYGRMGIAEGVGYLNERLAPAQAVEVRVVAVEALTSIAEKRPEIRDLVLQQVVQLIDNDKEPIRFATAQALTRIGDASVAEQVRVRLERESSARVRQALTQALQRI
jgi:HEAT repeat protein